MRRVKMKKIRLDFSQGKCPIKEVVAELEYDSGKHWDSWDFTLPGRLYDRVKNDFPEKSFTVITETGSDPSRSGPSEKNIRVTIQARAQFYNPEEAFLQLGHDLIVLNYIGDQPFWEKNLKSLFGRTFMACHEAINGSEEVTPIKRLSLQYINKIDIPGHQINLTDFFNYFPSVPSGFGEQYGAFRIMTQIPQNSRSYVLVDMRSAIPESKDSSCVWLVIHIVELYKKKKLKIEAILDWFKVAHDLADDYFTNIITRQMIELLGAKPVESSCEK